MGAQAAGFVGVRSPRADDLVGLGDGLGVVTAALEQHARVAPQELVACLAAQPRSEGGDHLLGGVVALVGDEAVDARQLRVGVEHRGGLVFDQGAAGVLHDSGGGTRLGQGAQQGHGGGDVSGVGQGQGLAHLQLIGDAAIGAARGLGVGPGGFGVLV